MRSTILSIAMGSIALGSITTGTLYSPAARAQSLEEVVVTARRREESLQDVPLSVTAFSGEAIDRAGFTSLEDVSMQTTGLQLNSDLGGTRPGRLFGDLRFRGVEGSAYSSLATSSAFVDGVFALQGAQSLALVDLERIEIVKGPQSALFGRNSFAGAINYVTRPPSLEEFGGKIMADAGQYEQQEFQASFEGPIIKDKLGFRLSASSYSKGNMFTASDGGALGEQSSLSISGQLHFKPTDQLTLKFRAYHQEDDDGSEAIAFFQGRLNDSCTGTTSAGFDANDNPMTLNPQNFLCGDVPDPGSAGAPRVDSNTSFFPTLLARNTVGNPGLTIANLAAGTLGGQNPLSDAPTRDSFGLERRMTRLSLAAEYEFNNGMVLNTVLARNENGAASVRDWDMTTAEAWYVTNPYFGEDTSFDIRLESDGEGRLRWLAGASWYDQEFQSSAGGGDLIHTCGFGSFAPGFPCTDAANFGQPLDAGDFVSVKGIYGSVSFDITDRLIVDAEARYQSDERNDGRPNAFELKVDAVLPRVSVTFKINEDINVYGTFSQSIIPGVINSNVLNCASNGVGAGVTQTVFGDFVQPYLDVNGNQSTADLCTQYATQGFTAPTTPDQELNAFEIGMKSTWMDGRLLANIAAYWQEWVANPSPEFVTVTESATGDGVPNPTQNFRNAASAGSSEYWGVELETVLAITDNWTANFNLTWNDNEYTVFGASTRSAKQVLGLDITGVTANLKGRRSSRFPEWSWNLSSTYTGQVNAEWDWFARGDVMFMGEAFAGQSNLATLQSYNLVNARFGIEKDDIRVEIYAKNLFDEDTWRGGAEFTDFSLLPEPLFAFNQLGIILLPNDKRTFGLRISLDF
jgi:iron complex outermembrane receptor protein